MDLRLNIPVPVRRLPMVDTSSAPPPLFSADRRRTAAVCPVPRRRFFPIILRGGGCANYRRVPSAAYLGPSSDAVLTRRPLPVRTALQTTSRLSLRLVRSGARPLQLRRRRRDCRGGGEARGDIGNQIPVKLESTAPTTDRRPGRCAIGCSFGARSRPLIW